MTAIQIKTQEFEKFRKYLHQHAGIDLSPEKKVMLASRLSKRLRHYNLDTYDDYFHLATNTANAAEKQLMIDILTTNETYFFREPKHFDFLRSEIQAKRFSGKHLRVWSAASSSGEEAYSIAMLLAETLPTQSWEIVGTDLSNRIIEKAKKAVYPMERIELLDTNFLKKYCLKGVREQTGMMMIDRRLRENVRFLSHNLLNDVPSGLGKFDVIFLRNVLIYFNLETKQKVISNLKKVLVPGGLLFISHSETLTRIDDSLRMIQPSIYEMP